MQRLPQVLADGPATCRRWLRSATPASARRCPSWPRRRDQPRRHPRQRGRPRKRRHTGRDAAGRLAGGARDVRPGRHGCAVGGLLTEDPTVPGEARTWLTTVLALRGGDADTVDHLWQALAHRLGEYREAVRLLERS